MTNSGDTKPEPGSRVVLTEVPPGLLDDLPEDAQLAINEVVGKLIQLNEYDENGSAELEFRDRNGDFHKIWVKPDFIRAPNDSELEFDALHRFIKKSDIISLRRELGRGMNPNLSNRFSWTLLMLAALEGKLSIGELLVSRGSKVNATNDFGETALSLAAHRGHTRFIRFLLANGASPDCRPHGSSLVDWLRASSGLSQDRIASVLDTINAANTQ